MVAREMIASRQCFADLGVVVFIALLVVFEVFIPLG
jgi:hypothetical protein